MRQIHVLSRIVLGLAYSIYGYIHFAYSHTAVAMLPADFGTPDYRVIFVGVCWWAVALSFFTNVWVRISGWLASALLVLILFFVLLPHWSGLASWLSVASILALAGGSLQLAIYGNAS